MNPVELLRNSVTSMDAILAEGLEETEFSRGTPCREFNVAALLDHVTSALDFVTMAAGGTVRPSPGRARLRLAASVDAAVERWSELGSDDIVPLGTDGVPAGVAASIQAFDVFVHTWDLARALDRSFEPDDRIVSEMWDIARMLITDDARAGTSAPFGPAVDVGVDASDFDRLIGFTGRDPRVVIGAP